MILCRLVGWLFVGIALMAGGAEILAFLETDAYRGIAVGELWYKIDVGSLNLAQAAVQRYVHPAAWDPVIVTVLQWHAWIVFGVTGLVLVLACRRGEPRAPGLHES
jgi:hypothetical protein